MKIVVENRSFKFDLGCRLLKLKYDECPFEQLEDIWDSIEPLTFKEISQMDNLEDRRVGIVCLGLERLVKEVKPTLINRETIEKETSFVDKDGNFINHKFSDTYELYKVDGSYFGKNSWGRNADDCHFVKFKDTSTDREYMIWIDLRSVAETNFSKGSYFHFSDEIKNKINAIQCIAWTMQTNIAEGNIKKILRQGDCILVKPKNANKPNLHTPRHLTEKEYRTLLVAES